MTAEVDVPQGGGDGMLATMGGILGVGLGYLMLRGLIAAMPEGTLPSEADLRLNIPVLLVAFAATTLAGLLFGCAPAWYAARVDPADSLKEGGRSGTSKVRQRLRQLLVVGEFTLALALLAGAGLAIAAKSTTLLVLSSSLSRCTTLPALTSPNPIAAKRSETLV